MLFVAFILTALQCCENQSATRSNIQRAKNYAGMDDDGVKMLYYGKTAPGEQYWLGAGNKVKDKEEAVRWFQQSAWRGEANAQFNLGHAYRTGQGVQRNEREAVRLFRAAAEQGLAAAQNGLGYAYWNGQSVIENKREAVRWFRAAAEQGDANAQFNLGQAHWNGVEASHDTDEAMRWYHKAASQGQADAQFRLGEVHGLNSFHGGVSGREAMRWLRKAADQGHAQAQFEVGRYIWLKPAFYLSTCRTLRWYSKAAQNGSASAQYWLGSLTDWQDHYEELRWYRKAAYQGHVSAQYNLAEEYGDAYYGHDDHEAYIWLYIAAANGHSEARSELDTFSGDISADEIMLAQKEAERRLKEIDRHKTDENSIVIADGSIDTFVWGSVFGCVFGKVWLPIRKIWNPVGVDIACWASGNGNW